MSPTFVLNLSKPIPSDQARFLRSDAFSFRLHIKYLKRLVLFFLSGQFFVERKHRGCLSQFHRILWINLSAPSIGDSLMDLSGRILLRGKQIDLLTSSLNMSLYQSDEIFKRVTCETHIARSWHSKNPYDVIILDSYAPRVILKKIQISVFAPIIGLYGFVNGFEVHRTYFSFYRLGYLLDVESNLKVLPKIYLPENLASSRNYPDSLCIAIGGEWEFRSYQHWIEVIAQLHRDYKIILVGSSNGLNEARHIVEKYSGVSSFVGKLTLLETAGVIKKCKLFVGADGGLWHIACSLDVPSVVLFADCSIFDESGVRHYRTTADMNAVSLYGDSSVSEIAAVDIIDAIRQMFPRSFSFIND